MAIAWFVGVDSQNAGCVKIMASDLYDPYLTPDSDFSKFLFNSKWDANVRFVGTDKLNYADGSFTQFYPSGSNKNNFKRLRWGDDIGTTWFYWKDGFWTDLGSLDYEFPVFDIKEFSNSGFYTYGRVRAITSGQSTIYGTNHVLEDGWCQNLDFSSAGGALSGVVLPNVLASFGRSGQHKRAVVWNLPGDEASYVAPSLAPVPGQTVVQITKDFCRAAKPGYDVQSATAAQLAFDSANRPAKIIAAADIAVPAGTSVYDFSANLAGITVTGELIADVIQYKGSTVYFPGTIPTDSDDYGANFSFSGNTLVFSNPQSACRARVLIISQDDSASTVGDNDVWREFNDGMQDVVQFLRPGAANPPNLADVIIDSRWPCLQIIKTGVINIPTGVAAETDVAFDSNGLFPFVKYFTIHGSGRINDSYIDQSASKRIRQPYACWGKAFNPDTGNYTTFIPGDCTYCRMTSGLLRFYTYRGNVHRFDYEKNSNNQYVLKSEAVTAPATKIRYYIFGIPA